MKNGSRKPARSRRGVSIGSQQGRDRFAKSATMVGKLPGNPQQEICKKKGRLGRPERRAARKRADWVSFNPAAPP